MRPWPTSHVQGIAVDLKGRVHLLFVHDAPGEVRFPGKLVGTLGGWAGHLGDLDFNPRDGRVYGSLEYKKDQAFYIAAIDVNRMTASASTRERREFSARFTCRRWRQDYAADLNGDGKFDGDVAKTPDHRFGCSGIDGVSFGPGFGRTDGPRYLTVAYGIYAHTSRPDNDHQVLLQYDTTDWSRYERALDEKRAASQRAGDFPGKFFVHDRQYDLWRAESRLRRRAAALVSRSVQRHQAIIPQLPAVCGRRAHIRPVMGELVGVPAPDGKGAARASCWRWRRTD
jgi:hypothetical protein